MASLSDGFVALPGGLGTLEEVFEVLTWSQLGIHRKPVGLVDVAGLLERPPHAPPPRRGRRLHPAGVRGAAPGRLDARRPCWTTSWRGARRSRRPSGSTRPRPDPRVSQRSAIDPAAGALLLVLCAIWGAGQVAIKVGNQGVSPLYHAAIRSAGAALLVWGWSAWRGIPLLRRDGTALYGATIATLFALEFVCVYWGFMFTTAVARGSLHLCGAVLRRARRPLALPVGASARGEDRRPHRGLRRPVPRVRRRAASADPSRAVRRHARARRRQPLGRDDPHHQGAGPSRQRAPDALLPGGRLGRAAEPSGRDDRRGRHHAARRPDRRPRSSTRSSWSPSRATSRGSGCSRDIRRRTSTRSRSGRLCSGSSRAGSCSASR